MLNHIATFLYEFFTAYAVVLGYFFMIIFSMVAIFIISILNYEFSKIIFKKTKNALDNASLYKGIKKELKKQNL